MICKPQQIGCPVPVALGKALAPWIRFCSNKSNDCQKASVVPLIKIFNSPCCVIGLENLLRPKTFAKRINANAV